MSVSFRSGPKPHIRRWLGEWVVVLRPGMYYPPHVYQAKAWCNAMNIREICCGR